MMNKWDVVLIRFPFTDLQSTKVRPAIVISPNSFHNSNEDGLFMLITSKTDRMLSFDLLVATNHPEFVRTGLDIESCIRVSKIAILKKTLISCRIGALGTQLSLAVENKLREFLELPPYQPPLAAPGPTRN